MKKWFILSFSLILAMGSLLIVPLQTVHADTNITGKQTLTFSNCSKKCDLSLNYRLSNLNTSTQTTVTIRVKGKDCTLGQGNPEFITQRSISTQGHATISNKVDAINRVSVDVRDKTSLFFCLFRGKTLVAEGTFLKGSDKDIKNADVHSVNLKSGPIIII